MKSYNFFRDGFLVLLLSIFFTAFMSGCGGSNSTGTTTTETNSDSSTTSDSNTTSDSDSSDSNTSTSTGDIGDRTDYDSVSLTSGGTYSSSNSDVENEYYSYSSTTSDVPAIKVESGGSLTLTYTKATKSGDTSDKENSGFYGFNAGVLASSSTQSDSYSGSGSTTTLTMTDATITTTAIGANGAFAFGEDATVTLDHVTIATTGDNNARGVDATYGGTVTITNSIISTQGDSCAALATDRYESYNAPTINATNVIGSTAGSGSPGIYCTGTFTVNDSNLTATGSEAVVVEGLNSVTLSDTNVSGAAKWGVMIYQSTSGDSSDGTGTFSMTGGNLVNNYEDGPLFFVCDTEAIINLDGATLSNASGTLLWATNASEGSTLDSNVNSDWGSNGGEVTFNASNQALEGDIIIQEESSSIALTLENSTYSGAINGDNSGGDVSVSIDADSSWEVTGDSYVNSLTNNGTITFNGGTLYVNGSVYSE